MGLTEQSRSARRYETLSHIERMISRTAFHQLKHSSLLLLCTIAAMAVTYLAPPLLLLAPNRLAIFMGAGAWVAMTITYSTMVRYYRIHPAWALTLPLAALFYLGATIHSAVKYWNGRGGDWKGRIQDVPDPRTTETRLREGH